MVTLRAEQKLLLTVYNLFLKEGYIVERVSKEQRQGMLEVGVRLLHTTTQVYTPIFYGQSGGETKLGLQEGVNAEIIALIYAGNAYGIELKYEEPNEIIPDLDAFDITKYAIANEMGKTVDEVVGKLRELGVDLVELEIHRDKLKRTGKRMTLDKLANFFFPEDRPTTIRIKKPIEVKKVEKEEEEVFKADY